MHQNSSNGAGEHQPSVWQSTVAGPAATLTPLTADTNTDVCIVGAGIAGLSVAYELTAAGKNVIVLDNGRIGTGMTGRTTGHLSNALDDRYEKLERLLGKEHARLAAESHTVAIDRIEEIVGTETISCDFERLFGYFITRPGGDPAELEREYEAASRAGVAVDWALRAPFPELQSGPAIRFAGQGQFHPLRYLTGLADAIRRRGGRIFTGTHAQTMEGGKGATLRTPGGTVTAQHLVIATNTPVNNRFVIHTKQAPYTTCAIAINYPIGSLPHALFWETADPHGGGNPYHYVRTWREPGREVLIVGGEDHKTGQHRDFEHSFAALERWAREHFPGGGEVGWRWSGQVFEPVDGMAFIGRNPLDAGNVYIVTGDSGNGLTHGVIAGMLLRSLIEGRPHRWESLYDPRRITLGAAADFVHENANVAAQFRDYFTSGDVPATHDIPAGGGAILREGLHKVAAYRDDHGVLHRFSAACPHLKCIVRWNSAERTWDCPCHGSRFDAMGRVLTGPANRDLDPAEETRDDDALVPAVAGRD